jgi:hypothetical protein
MSMAHGFASPGFRLASAFVLASAMVAAPTSVVGGGDGTAAAQEPNPCALVRVDDIQPLAPKAQVAEGVSSSIPAVGRVICRYTWGAATSQFKLDVVVNEASRLFPGSSPDLIKQQIRASPRPGTDDAALADIGEAAAFTSDSPVYATTTAYSKGRILQMHLDGLYARDRKAEMIAVLKAVVSRL